LYEDHVAPVLRHLTQHEARLVQAFGETCFPDDGGELVGSDHVDIVGWMDGHLERLPRVQRWQIRAMFVAFEAEFALKGRAHTRSFADAHLEERQRYVETMEASGHYVERGPLVLMKGLMMLAYLRHPDVRRGMGIGRNQIGSDE
jgi:hypothetical protein